MLGYLIPVMGILRQVGLIAWWVQFLCKAQNVIRLALMFPSSSFQILVSPHLWIRLVSDLSKGLNYGDERQEGDYENKKLGRKLRIQRA